MCRDDDRQPVATPASQDPVGPPVFATANQSNRHDSPGEGRGASDLLRRLAGAFGQDFAVIDTARGTLGSVTADWPGVDWLRWLPLAERVARDGRVEVLEDHAPLLLLAVPLPSDDLDPPSLAVTVLLTDAAPSAEALESAARVFGVAGQRLTDWASGRKPFPAHAAIGLASALGEAESARRNTLETKSQLSDVSNQLLATFEELHLLHQLTEGLSLGRTEHELIEQSVHQLAEVVPSDCVVAWVERNDGQPPLTLCRGDRQPIESERLATFLEDLGPQAKRRAIVLNRDRTDSPTWAYPEVREVVSAPILANDRPIGWVAALNYRAKRGVGEGSFGAIEASLLSSVAALVGVHAGNRSLFAERTSLFESAVHALTSAIDAKDRYTCGHSDRVARFAVRLAKQLGCDHEQLNTIYLGGLLHDIGKIGIDDSVLRKPDRLTDEEFEQIKLHPALGEQILHGVPHLAHVLPIVLHHHEAWDGSGYPGGLVGEESPLLARITAVADSLDAMSSDRPYRKGMPIERVEQILREGAGAQWDPAVIDAYFAVRDEMVALSRLERDPLNLDVGRWTEGDACPLG